AVGTGAGGRGLARAGVGGNSRNGNGDITLDDGSVVEGTVRYSKPSGWHWSASRDPRVVIGRDSEVRGELVFEREVELYVHESAKIGKVTGATVQRYSGNRPPR